MRETVTLGQEAQLDGITIDWSQNPPLIRVVVRASRPDVPSPKQVAEVQQLNQPAPGNSLSPGGGTLGGGSGGSRNGAQSRATQKRVAASPTGSHPPRSTQANAGRG